MCFVREITGSGHIYIYFFGRFVFFCKYFCDTKASNFCLWIPVRFHYTCFVTYVYCGLLTNCIDPAILQLTRLIMLVTAICRCLFLERT